MYCTQVIPFLTKRLGKEQELKNSHSGNEMILEGTVTQRLGLFQIDFGNLKGRGLIETFKTSFIFSFQT